MRAYPGRETKGKSKQFEKEGGDRQAGEDFESVCPTNVRNTGHTRWEIYLMGERQRAKMVAPQ